MRGTVQADILKEDQGQNTCIFSTEFSLKVMGDIAEYFVHHDVRNFYSVSISGYHIAEAGANPISQLAFTLSNGFTFVEAYLARGMHIDDFAPNLSFFFSNGMDPEYTVLGRVARRIWAVAMREKYGANERSQKLKYHIQTSGRSLHAQEIAVQRHPHHAAGADRGLRQLQQPAHQRLRRGDHHAHRGKRAPGDGDPAHHQPRVGPGEEREPEPGQLHRRRADRAGRGGRAGRVRARSPSAAGCSARWKPATSAARSRKSRCTTRCSSTPASYPIIGVNTFRNPHGDPVPDHIELARSTEDEKRSQLARLADFHARHADSRPRDARSAAAVPSSTTATCSRC
jgi:methylmalonyl-CoA mutase